jgi:class 3 adenylate cyclase/tetratricopeptide (TPR) repeat protein
MLTCAGCGAENPDGFRHCGHCGAALRTTVSERRTLATLLFCDLSGSTAMGERIDAESLREMMHLYFREMRATLERHGGTVEKFIGDAVVAVFGVPEAHEDDALRACRAALEMQARVAVLNDDLERRFGERIAVRIGLNTGEVVGNAHNIVAGDPVNVAARLEQAAGPGEVLLGGPTLRLVRDAVTVEPVEPVGARGKAEPLQAYRLLDVSGFGAVPRRMGTPFLAREDELRVLENEFESVVGERACRLVTVVGEPGVGKSRLVAEFVDRVGARARVVRGTCLSYGEGTTYWAIGQIVRELAGVAEHHSRAEARALIEARVARGPNDRVAATISQLIGLSEGSATAPQTARAITDFLVASAASGPLVVVVDDIHWAEQTLLDLLSGLPSTVDGASILLLCLSRPELLEERPAWDVTVSLEPLGERVVDMLMSSLLGTAQPAVRERLAKASAGNPLFVEELVAMLVDEGVLRIRDGVCTLAGDLEALALPASLHALLGARLDRIEPDVRGTLERGAIEGELFHRGAVVALSPPELRASTPANLETLTRKDLIRPTEPRFAGEAAFSFRHILVRDAAYRTTSKKLRAVLHEQFADWLERSVGERVVEYEEILGYHLEQSYRYRSELGPIDSEVRAIGDRAAARLAEAGRRAARRGDINAASGLLGRASDLLPAGHEARARIVVQLGEALMDAGRNADAIRVFDELDGSEGVDEVSRAHADVCRGEIELQLPSTSAAAVDVLQRRASDALALFTARDDEQARLRACWLLYLTSMTIGRAGAAQDAIETLKGLAEPLSHPLAGRLPGMLAANLAWGPTPVADALETTTRMLRTVRDDPAAEPLVLTGHAYLLAQVDEIAESRRSLARMREIAERWGQRIVLWSAWGQNVGRTELLAGDPERAERALRPCYDALREAGNLAFCSTLAGQLAHALVELERPEEAVTYAAAARDAAGEADVLSQILWRSALSRALVAQGAVEESIDLSDQAVRLAESTEWPNVIADALLDRARVLQRAGGDPALDARRADVLYLAKGNLAGHEKATILAAATDRVGSPPQTGEGAR